jgi:LCP family protein required for cell wall assembly
MDCTEARHLLERGIIPGSATPERAALGFHLVGCPACRSYRQMLEQRFLNDLLLQAEPLPIAPPAAPVARPPTAKVVALAATAPRRPWRARAAHSLWYIGVAMLAALPLTVVAIIGWAALTSFRIHQNVQAMIVTTETPDAPAALVSTATPLPTATLLPTMPPATPTLVPPTATPLPTVPPATPTPAAPAAGAPATVLLLGSDQRPGEHDPSRTDAIIVARIDPQAQRVALLSLPRDLWVPIPGYGQTRINAAHVWGQVYEDPEGGIGLARKTVSNLLGIPIDYTVYVDFAGFIGAIDALGGVTVDVDKELYDANFPTMDYGYTVAHFLPGPQQMDGATALMYSRIRHPDSDFARMHRQQAVLAGVLATLRGQNALQDLGRLEGVTAALRDYVKTDMPEQRLLGLAWALRTLDPQAIEHYALEANMITFGVGDDQYAEVALPGTLERLAQQLLGP